MKVFLTGFMGAGKTAVGRRLAERLAFESVDLDLEVERRAGRSIAEIFASSGEGEFRRLERAALEAVCERSASLVVATGGGTAAREANRDLMRERGVVVWLDVPLAVIRRRLTGSGDGRPLYGTADEVERLYRERRPAYSAADLRIETGATENRDEIALRIAEMLAERAQSVNSVSASIE